MAAMLEFRTQGYNPYAVKYSPYYDSRLAVATSANFGIVGNGRVFTLGLSARGIEVEKTYVRLRGGNYISHVMELSHPSPRPPLIGFRNNRPVLDIY